eukprot:snap_masked-scaffold483_size159862-processed-gene-0.24 protein:Tk08700 transcript:snap_masked-scaffold483_size159862-processed-gene-0.24-mRNA-1 annotation:"sialic acid synthase"
MDTKYPTRKEQVTNLTLGPGKIIGPNHPCFFVAEIGQNHQGDFTLACELIKRSKLAGADCVKFQRGHLEHKFTPSALHRPYDNDRSWAYLYGEHKRVLDFTREEFVKLKDFAQSQDILFSSSAMDIDAAQFLLALNLPFIKVGSGDINNGQLLDFVGRHTDVNLILSTGMCRMEQVQSVYDRMKGFDRRNFVLLQCTSAYPTPPQSVNLKVISAYRKQFSDINIGYSGHERGCVASLGAVALGAKVVERHVTLDKSMRGADHGCSLDMKETQELVDQIRLLENNLGCEVKAMPQCELDCYKKLGKSVVAKQSVPINTIIHPEHIDVKAGLGTAPMTVPSAESIQPLVEQPMDLISIQPERSGRGLGYMLASLLVTYWPHMYVVPATSAGAKLNCAPQVTDLIPRLGPVKDAIKRGTSSSSVDECPSRP